MLRFLAAHDSGRILNPKTFRNQVFGGITMGIGFGLTEERVMDRGQLGKLLTANLHDYKLPTALDAPADKTVVVVDPHDTRVQHHGRQGRRRARDDSHGAGDCQRGVPRDGRCA